MYTFTEYLCAKKREKKPLEQCNNKIEKKETCYSTDTKV